MVRMVKRSMRATETEETIERTPPRTRESGTPRRAAALMTSARAHTGEVTTARKGESRSPMITRYATQAPKLISRFPEREEKRREEREGERSYPVRHCIVPPVRSSVVLSPRRWPV
jgi:hypothetical protein